MTLDSIPEYTPLLPPGLHVETLNTLREKCVSPFALSKTRKVIFSDLEDVIDCLVAEGIPAEIWIDGSFMTEKIDPNDVDLVVSTDRNWVLTANERQQAVLQAINGNLKSVSKCDTYFFLRNAQTGASDYWQNQFGSDRNGFPKGIAVIDTTDASKATQP